MNTFKLESVDNFRIKRYKKLAGSKKYRYSEGLFILEGLRLVSDALKSGVEVFELYIEETKFKKIRNEIESLNVYEVYLISEEISNKISETISPQGIFGVFKITKSNVKFDFKKKYVMLDKIQNPDNLGAVSRTAEALGIAGLILSGGCDIYNPKALRASMGSLLRLPVFITESSKKAVDEFLSNGMKVYITVPQKDALSIKTADFSGGVVTVIGNEANGVCKEILESRGEKITVDMKGSVESLNASAAAIILMWEMCRFD